MIESEYTKAIHRKLPQHLYTWKICDPMKGGVPDAFYRNTQEGNRMHMRKPLWVEYKFIKSLPSKGETRVVPDLSIQQRMFLDDAWENGEQALVILGVDDILGPHCQRGGFIFETPTTWGEGVKKSELGSALFYDDISDAIQLLTS